jgi:hypothetical protein
LLPPNIIAEKNHLTFGSISEFGNIWHNECNCIICAISQSVIPVFWALPDTGAYLTVPVRHIDDNGAIALGLELKGKEGDLQLHYMI